MNEMVSAWCCAGFMLAMWLLSMRTVREIRKQAEELQAAFADSCPGTRQELPEGRMEQVASWSELHAHGELLKSGSPGTAGRKSNFEFSLNTPWLYLSLALMLWLLLL